jgi:hypothetical protein
VRDLQYDLAALRVNLLAQSPMRGDAVVVVDHCHVVERALPLLRNAGIACDHEADPALDEPPIEPEMIVRRIAIRGCQRLV